MQQSNIQENYLKQLLQFNLRPDGRQNFQARQFKVSFLEKKGHLLCSLGSTKILIKISSTIIIPKPTQPSQGNLIFKLDCSSGKGTIDENRKLSAQLIKLLERIVIGCNAVDPQSLCIMTGKSAWEIKIDITLIYDGGNVIDIVLNGVLVALMDMKLPMLKLGYEGVGSPFIDKQQPLSIAHLPFCRTFGLVENNMIMDPSQQEQKILLSRITIAMNVYGQVCMINKIGGMVIEKQILQGAIQVTQRGVKQFTQQIRKIVQMRQKNNK